MDKNDLLDLLNRYTDSSPEEAKALASLKSEYPYSQLLQTLYARLSKDHAFDDHASELALAATRSADRSVLKNIITERKSNGPPKQAVVERPTVTPLPGAPPADGGIDYAEEVMRDLERLVTLKSNFEMLLVEYSEVKAKPQPAKRPEPPSPPKPAQEHAKGKLKKQRIVELARQLQSDSKSPDGDETTQKANTKSRRKKSPGDQDGLIEEIKSSKKELPLGSEKQKEQIDIINNFIKTQPTISGAKEKIVLPPGDLTPIRSGEFGDNIVSETLVEILVKQGKKDKAIEVLKKLIWKYPQKKAYFASQIEDLKK